MIFDRDKRDTTFYSDLIIHTAIFISISLTLFSSNSFLNFVLITCMIIYLSNGSKIKWHYSLLILLWGIYSDLIIGYPIGYSSCLFLCFLLLNQISNYFGIFSIDNIRFLIFILGVFLFSVIEHSIIYLQFGTNISISLKMLEILIILIFYYPINYIMKNIFNFYVSKE